MEGQTYHGIEKLALNNMMSDTTYMKETLSYDVYEFLGVAVPDYSYSNIKVNGREWGLYLAVETIEENFLQKEFGSSEGNLYKPESMEMGGNMDTGGRNIKGQANQADNRPQGFQQNRQQQAVDKNGMNNRPQQNMGFGRGAGGGANLKYTDDNPSSYSVVRDGAVFKRTTDKDFEKVIDMIKNLNDGTNLEQYLDVEEVLKYFAVNTFLVNLDSYSGGMYHNYYLYEKNGMFKILPWDLNMSFAGFSMGRGAGSSSAESAINFPIDKPVSGELEDAPLIGNLLKVDKYKELYHSYLDKIVKEYVDNGTFENSVAKINELIGDYVKKDATAFYTYEQYEKSIPELISFGKDRALSVASQLSGEQPSTTNGNIKTKVNLSSLGSMNMGGQGFGGDRQGAGQEQQNSFQSGQKPGEGTQNNNQGQQKPSDNSQRPEMGGVMPGVGRGDKTAAPGGKTNSNNGQFPAMGGVMPNMENMPSQENMVEIMNIIQGADINNLTAEQKEN
jgi:Spore coat assembly protein